MPIEKLNIFKFATASTSNLVNCIANLLSFVMQLTGLCVYLEVIKTPLFNRNCC